VNHPEFGAAQGNSVSRGLKYFVTSDAVSFWNGVEAVRVNESSGEKKTERSGARSVRSKKVKKHERARLRSGLLKL
jgi:hypothetical protein